MLPPEFVSCEAMSAAALVPTGSLSSLSFPQPHGNLHFRLCGYLHWVLLDLPPRVSFPAERSIHLEQTLQAALTQCLGLFCPSIQAHLLLLYLALAL